MPRSERAPGDEQPRTHSAHLTRLRHCGCGITCPLASKPYSPPHMKTSYGCVARSFSSMMAHGSTSPALSGREADGGGQCVADACRVPPMPARNRLNADAGTMRLIPRPTCCGRSDPARRRPRPKSPGTSTAARHKPQTWVPAPGCTASGGRTLILFSRQEGWKVAGTHAVGHALGASPHLKKGLRCKTLAK